MTQIDLTRTANVPVTEGMHSFQIVDGEEGEGPKGTYWKFTVVCLDDGEADKTIIMVISLSPAARWKLEIFLDAVNAPKKGKAALEKFLNRKFRGNVTHELYEGRTQARIGEMFPFESGTARIASTTSIKTAEVEDAIPDDAIEDDEISF
jgi:hypothetical protein